MSLATIVYHPALVHFPIAFYFLELLLLTLWVWKKDDGYLRFGRFSFWLGYGLMLAAIVAGFVDAGGIKGIRGDEEVREHFFGAAALFSFYTVRAIYWKKAKSDFRGYRLILTLGALIGCGLVVFTAFLGSELVY